MKRKWGSALSMPRRTFMVVKIAAGSSAWLYCEHGMLDAPVPFADLLAVPEHQRPPGLNWDPQEVWQRKRDHTDAGSIRSFMFNEQMMSFKFSLTTAYPTQPSSTQAMHKLLKRKRTLADRLQKIVSKSNKPKALAKAATQRKKQKTTV